MKLILAVMSGEDAVKTSSALSKAGHLSTMLNGEGGFLHTEKKILMVGVENMRVRDVLQHIEQNSHSREESVDLSAEQGFYTLPERVRVGGAAVFVIDVDQFHRM